MIFLEDTATPNERALRERFDSHRTQIDGLINNHDRLKLRYERLESVLFGKVAPQAPSELLDGGLLDGFHGTTESLQAQLDQTITALNMLTESVLAADKAERPFEQIVEKLKAVDLSFLKKLEAFFYPMLEGKTPPLDGNEIATKAFVDKALERIAGRLREEIAKIAKLADQPKARPSRLAALVFALTGREVAT